MKNPEVGSPESQLSILVNALKLLSGDFKDQITSFPEFVVVTDELALGFEDAFLLARQLHTAGFISDEVWRVLIEINVTLSQMKNDDTIWGKAGLENAVQWEKCRTLSKKALDIME